ncbi:MAG: hypothetical protein Rubg2KO_41420 [Rubricoccaceae bacterium]
MPRLRDGAPPPQIEHKTVPMSIQFREAFSLVGDYDFKTRVVENEAGRIQRTAYMADDGVIKVDESIEGAPVKSCRGYTCTSTTADIEKLTQQISPGSALGVGQAPIDVVHEVVDTFTGDAADLMVRTRNLTAGALDTSGMSLVRGDTEVQYIETKTDVKTVLVVLAPPLAEAADVVGTVPLIQGQGFTNYNLTSVSCGATVIPHEQHGDDGLYSFRVHLPAGDAVAFTMECAMCSGVQHLITGLSIRAL